MLWLEQMDLTMLLQAQVAAARNAAVAAASEHEAAVARLQAELASLRKAAAERPAGLLIPEPSASPSCLAAASPAGILPVPVE